MVEPNLCQSIDTFSVLNKVIIYKFRGEPFFMEQNMYDIWAGFGPVGSTENFRMAVDYAGVPYGVRLVRPRSYFDFAK
jgi:hypothetical protein